MNGLRHGKSAIRYGNRVASVTALCVGFALLHSAPAYADAYSTTLSGATDAPSSTSADAELAKVRNIADEMPRLGMVESPFGMARGTVMAALSGTADNKSNYSGGLRLGGSPLEGLGFHGFIQRNTDGEWSPVVTAHYRILGSLADGYALGALAQYKAEGFTELGGETELGITAGLRRSRFILDLNVIAGVGVEEKEEGEVDWESRLRAGYEVTRLVRAGVEGQTRMRLAGDRRLPGGRNWDFRAGPQLTFKLEPVVAALSAGATTVDIATGVGSYAMLTVGAVTGI